MSARPAFIRCVLACPVREICFAASARCRQPPIGISVSNVGSIGTAENKPHNAMITPGCACVRGPWEWVRSMWVCDFWCLELPRSLLGASRPRPSKTNLTAGCRVCENTLSVKMVFAKSNSQPWMPGCVAGTHGCVSLWQVLRSRAICLGECVSLGAKMRMCCRHAPDA